MPDGACPELDEWVPASPFLLLLEGRFPLEAGMTDEEEEDDTLSSFTEVPLSPPQATRAIVKVMDAIMLYLKFLILNLVHIHIFIIKIDKITTRHNPRGQRNIAHKNFSLFSPYPLYNWKFYFYYWVTSRE